MTWIPGGKSFADMVRGNPASRGTDKPKEPPKENKENKENKETPADSVAPKPKVQPRPAAKALPAANSGSAVQHCFKSLSEQGYPLGFASLKEFETCMEDLCQKAKEANIICTVVGVRGSAATYTSNNPNKSGQFFDSRGAGKSDIDAFIVSDTHLRCRPNAQGFFHPSKVAFRYPILKAWSKAWTKTLKRDITPGVHKKTSPALEEDYIPYACGSCKT